MLSQHNRNNWVIPGGPRGAEASADLYSLIGTSKLNGLEPNFALRYILTKLLRQRGLPIFHPGILIPPLSMS